MMSPPLYLTALCRPLLRGHLEVERLTRTTDWDELRRDRERSSPCR
jgi:hypothetical protein